MEYRPWRLAAGIIICLGIGLVDCGGGSSGATAPLGPAITVQPQSQTVNAGQMATFTVTATGTAPLNFQWRRGASPISAATGASFTTTAAIGADNGAQYSVAVSNDAGSVISNSAALVVSTTATDALTYHNDNQRTGANLTETVLTTVKVNRANFGLLARYPVDGKVDAQPLVVSNFTINAGVHDVLFVATENDTLYALDPVSGKVFWQHSMLATGETPSDARGCDQVTPVIGITATPVIDRASGIIYVVAMTKDGSGNYFQRLHALRLTDGSEMLGGPVSVAASYPAPGASGTTNGQLVFQAGQYKERSALLLLNGTIFTSWASHCDIDPYSGWVIAYSASTLRQTAVYNTEPNGNLGGNPGQGSFWNSNSGPAADAAGNLYMLSANGVFDTTLDASGFPAGQDYGNALIKFSAPAGTVLAVSDYFTMFDTVSQSSVDGDFGSGGVMLLPDLTDRNNQKRQLVVAAGKDQNLYVLDRNNLGKFNPANNNQIYQEVVGAFSGGSGNCGTGRGVYGAPAYFNGYVYYGAVGKPLQAFAISNARLGLQPSSVTGTNFCYPGATPSVSANGTSNAIIWSVENSNIQGVLHAYDAGNLATELYNSAQAGTRDMFGPGSKFTPPTVVNGRVFVTTQNASGQNFVAVFGLLH
jgi:hypothetical protein